MILVTKSLLSRWERLSFSEDLFTPHIERAAVETTMWGEPELL